MKKLIFILIGVFLLAGTASASLYNYYKDNGQSLPTISQRVSEAQNCGIRDYTGTYEQNIRLEGCLRNKEVGSAMLGSSLPIAGSTYNLAGSGITGSATSITLQSLTIKQSGYKILDSDLSDTFYITLEPGNNKKQEIASCTTVIQNANGTATLTGCQRGLMPFSPYTSSTNYQFSHAGGSQVIFSDPPQLFNRYVSRDDGLMDSGYNPTSLYQVTTKNYVDTRNGYYEAPVANFAALPAGVNQGEMRVTLDDGKVYTWSGSTWILAGAGGGAGTVYRDDYLATNGQTSFNLSSGSWPAKKYLQVYVNGTLMEEGASADYVASTTGSNIVFNSGLNLNDKVTMRVESIDFYNPAWTSVNTDLLPDVTATHNLGSSTKQFKDLNLSGTANTSQLNVSGNASVTGTTTLATTTFTGVVSTTNIYVDNVKYNTGSSTKIFQGNFPYNTNTTTSLSFGFIPSRILCYVSGYNGYGGTGGFSSGVALPDGSNFNTSHGTTVGNSIVGQASTDSSYCGIIYYGRNYAGNPRDNYGRVSLSSWGANGTSSVLTLSSSGDGGNPGNTYYTIIAER